MLNEILSQNKEDTQEKRNMEVINAGIFIERSLKKLGARGKGIKALINDSQSFLSDSNKEKLNFCNHLRNRLLHTDNKGRAYKITDSDYEKFKSYYTDLQVTFEKIENERKRALREADDRIRKSEDKSSGILSTLFNFFKR